MSGNGGGTTCDACGVFLSGDRVPYRVVVEYGTIALDTAYDLKLCVRCRDTAEDRLAELVEQLLARPVAR